MASEVFCDSITWTRPPHLVETGYHVADRGTRLQLHADLTRLTAPDDLASRQTGCPIPTFDRPLEANRITGNTIVFSTWRRSSQGLPSKATSPSA